MRLRERSKRPVALYAWTGMDEDVYTWGERTDIRASVYPAACGLEASVCGERIEERLLMLVEGDVSLQIGMGVALEGGVPQYRIVALERWSHGAATIERIAEGRRGHAV